MRSERGHNPVSGTGRRRTRRGIASAVALVVTAAAAGVVPTPAGAQSLTATNLAIAGSEFVPLEGGRFAFLVDEDSQGSGDRNGDGDAGDHVIAVWDPASGSVDNLGVALESGSPVALAGGGLAFIVSEDAQGGLDRNGNGDTGNGIVAVWESATGITTNLELAGDSIAALEGGGFVFALSEWTSGELDRNGDGDAKDRVAAVWEPTTGVTELGLSADLFVPLEAGGFAFTVPEGLQGGQDRNGDGDIWDSVVAVWDPATRLVANLGLAGQPVVALEGARLALTAMESQQGEDRNGDGDTYDPVVAVWDRATGLIVNLGLAVNGGHYILALDGGRLAFTVPEASQGGADRNGDGDAYDEVLAVVEILSDLSFTATNLGLVSYYPVALDGGSLAFTVPEASQGGADRNGDGDASDQVIAVWDPAAGTTSNLGLAGAYPVALDGGALAFSVSEWSHFGADRNGDGDAADKVVAVWDPALGVTSLGIATYGITPLAGGGLASAVFEPAEASTDRNGDGDASDLVVMAWDPVGGATNLALAQPVGFGYDPVALDGSGFVLTVGETPQGSTDRNGDGDDADAVIAVALPAPAMSVETEGLPVATVGTPYEAALAASGGQPPYTWEVTSGSLPEGLALGADGTISGTPSGPAGPTSFTVTATDSAPEPGTDSAALTISVERGATGLAVDPVGLRLLPPKLTAGTASARLSGGALLTGLAGETVAFTAAATPLCSAVTGADGTATCSLDAAGVVAALGRGGITASYAGSASWLPTTGTGGLVG